MVTSINALSFYIAQRYIRSSHYNRFAKLIQNLSVCGIAAGVMVLIVISSIFNGFHQKITESLHTIKPHLVVTHEDYWWNHWQETKSTIEQMQNITTVEPRLRTYGMLAAQQQSAPIQLIGHSLSEANHAPTGKSSTTEPFPVTLSSDLHHELWMNVDDTMGILTTTSMQQDSKPIALRVRIEHIQNDASQYMNARSIQTDRTILAKALRLPETTITELDITTNDIFSVEQTITALKDILPEQAYISNHSSRFTSLISSLAMQRKMMIIVLSFVVIIAAFNLITSLVMIVTERKKEIAVLQTLGLSRLHIIGIFVIQGLLLTTVGIVIGCIFGVTIAWHITDAMNAVEAMLGQKIMSDQVWMLNHLPSVVRLSDCLFIAGFTLCLAVITALYPAYLASRVEPAEVLRYE